MDPLFFNFSNEILFSNKVVYLDRDGVILAPVIRKEEVSSVRKIKEILIYDDAIKLCMSLKKKGYSLIVLSNQPDLSRGLIDFNFLEQTSQIIKKVIDIDLFLYCPHQDFNKCSCRKPNPGMVNFFRSLNKNEVTQEFMVGDRLVDYNLALSAKIPFILRIQPYSFFNDGRYLQNLVPGFFSYEGILEHILLNTIDN